MAFPNTVASLLRVLFRSYRDSDKFLEGLTDANDSLGWRRRLLLGNEYLWLVCLRELAPTAGLKTFTLELCETSCSLLSFWLEIIVVPCPVWLRLVFSPSILSLTLRIGFTLSSSSWLSKFETWVLCCELRWELNRSSLMSATDLFYLARESSRSLMILFFLMRVHLSGFSILSIVSGFSTWLIPTLCFLYFFGI